MFEYGQVHEEEDVDVLSSTRHGCEDDHDGELQRHILLSMDTTREISVLPSSASSGAMASKRTSTSRIAAHSNADPRAIAWKWARSAVLVLPQASAMFTSGCALRSPPWTPSSGAGLRPLRFSGIEVLARRSWSRRSA